MLQPRSTKIPQNNDPSSGSSQHRKLAQLATSAHHKLTISKSSGHPAHRCYETAFGAFTKNNIDPVPGTSSKLIKALPALPHFLLQNASLLQCPLPWTPHFILDSEVNLNPGQVAGWHFRLWKASQRYQKKRNFTLMDPQMVRMFRMFRMTSNFVNFGGQ